MPKSYSVDLRERVLNYLETNPNKKIASALFQVGIATIYRWISCKKIRGNVQPLRRKYAYKKIDDQKLIEYVEAHPDHFLSEIAKHFGLTLQAIFYALKRLKISRKKRRTLYLERKEEVRASFIEKLEHIPLDQRIYLDESGINQYLHRKHARSTRGKKVLGEISGKRFARQSVVSALFKGKFFCPMCFEGTCNTILFNTWLKQILIPNLSPGQVLILDNASFHKSAETKNLVEAAGCKIFFLPPYSPDLNPIEKYWANMKKKVRELLVEVQTFTQALDQAILSM